MADIYNVQHSTYHTQNLYELIADDIANISQLMWIAPVVQKIRLFQHSVMLCLTLISAKQNIKFYKCSCCDHLSQCAAQFSSSRAF